MADAGAGRKGGGGGGAGARVRRLRGGAGCGSVARMRLSFVIMTRNRRAVLTETLARLPGLAAGDGLGSGEWEAVVVDNASTDGTGAGLAGGGIAEVASRVVSVVLTENAGCGARNVGVERARGGVIVFLDDDSWPKPGALTRSLATLDTRPEVGLLGGRTELAGGGLDHGALPLVPPCCGLVVRRAVFHAVGGFDAGYLMQAEELELVSRVLAAGHAVVRDPAVGFVHLKSPVARASGRTARLDLRNNLVWLRRWTPEPLRKELWADWTARYAALARHAAAAGGEPVDAAAAVAEAETRDVAWAAAPLGEAALETLFRAAAIRDGVAAWAAAYGARRVVLLGYTKTLFFAWAACRAAGLEVAAVADDGPAFAGLDYRGVPVVPLRDAAARGTDGWVLADRNPARIEARTAAARDAGVTRLWRMDEPDAGAG